MLLCVGLIVIASACAAGSSATENSRPALCADDGGDVRDPSGELLQPLNGDGKLTIYVSNQSFDREQVGIQMTIDGVTQIDADFCVGTQHNQIRFVTSAQRRDHALVISTDTGATEEITVDLSTDRWVTISYLHDPPQLVSEIGDEEPDFG